MLFRNNTPTTTPSPTTPGSPAAIPNRAWPHLLCSGDGTEASPYSHPDGTGGIQTAVNVLKAGRGGLVQLVAGRYEITKPEGVLIDSPSIAVVGDQAGFNRDPNASTRGITGTTLAINKVAFRLGINGGARIGNIRLSEIYIYGPGLRVADSAALQFIGRVDQGAFLNMHVSQVENAVVLLNGSNLDTPCFYRFDALYCRRGYYDTSNLPSFFPNFADCCLSDLAGESIVFNNQCQQAMLKGNVLVRPAEDGGDCVTLGGRGHIFTGNVIRDPSLNFLSENPATNRKPATGVRVTGNDCIVSNNQITSNKLGSGVVLAGNRNRAEHNSFAGALGDQNNGLGEVFSQDTYFSTNQVDVEVTNTAADNVVTQFGLFTLLESGVRTVVNGQGKNAGDPNQAGNSSTGNYWGYIAKKSDGLRLYDTANDVLYEYRSYYPGGRRVV